MSHVFQPVFQFSQSFYSLNLFVSGFNDCFLGMNSLIFCIIYLIFCMNHCFYFFSYNL
ncbi:hypothetical protein HMPREF1419_01387 [Helicobacter pylori GAM263BFi]|nr:hypothetical protein HMPREF1419_01387 [Helicobacter pylori GAM263BFi]